MTSQAVLYIVATPIGNLDDISQRAARILKNVDLIAAEDTRRARQLLQQLGRERADIISYYDQVEQEKAAPLVERIVREGLSLALISDAGTPCISDPGYRLVREARKAGVTVHPIPGPSALTALVSASGLPSDRLLFVGFLPSKASALLKEVKGWRASGASVVFYEAPRRLLKSLEALEQVYPHAELAIGRELTKLHEEIILTDIQGAKAWCTDHEFLKGEAAVMLSLGPEGSMEVEEAGNVREAVRREAQQAFEQGSSLKDLLKAMRDRGIPRSELYQLLLEVKETVDEPSDE